VPPGISSLNSESGSARFDSWRNDRFRSTTQCDPLAILPEVRFMLSMIMRIIRHPVLVILLLGGLFGGAAAPAHGQGTMGQLPDPMSGRELMTLLERHLDLTPEQWDAIDELHAGYLERFRVLREGPIESFLSGPDQMMFERLPDRRQLERFIQKLGRVESMIKATDEALFESIVPLIAEDLASELMRVRLARERVRLLSGFALSSGASPPARGLWSTVESIALEAEQLQSLDPVLRDYEQKITTQLRTWHEGSVRSLGGVLDELESRGLDEVDLASTESDPELMEEVLDAFEVAYRASAEMNFAQCKRTRDLTQSKLLELCRLLDPESARRLKIAYVSSGLFQGFSVLSGEVSDGKRRPDLLRDVEVLLSDGRVPPELHKEIELIAATYLLEDHDLLDELCRVIRDYDPMLAMADYLPSLMDEEGAPSESERLSDRFDERTNDRNELDRVTRERLRGLLRSIDEGRSAIFIEWEHVRDDPVEEAFDGFLDADMGLQGTGFMPGRRNWVLDPISVPDLARIRRILGLDDSTGDVVTALHERYLEQWAVDVQAVKTSIDAEDDRTSVNAQSLQEQAIANARELDLAFFDELGVSLPVESTSLVPMLREDRRYEHAMSRNWPVGPQPGPYERVNPIRILLDSEPDRIRELLPILSEETAPLFDALEALHVQRFLGWCESERTRVAVYREYETSDRPQGISFDSIEAASRSMSDVIRPLQQALVERSERFESMLAASCGEAFLEGFRLEMLQAANPNIYRDASDIRPVFERVLQLNDLGVQQRERIKTLSEDFSGSWSDLSRRMTTTNPWSVSVMTDDLDGQRAFQDDMNRYEQLDFRRQELSGRTLRRLARLLDVEQRGRFRVFQGVLDGADRSP
jgi:hypothetical protein